MQVLEVGCGAGAALSLLRGTERLGPNSLAGQEYALGLFINAAGRNTLRFVPPLIISADELRQAMQRLRRTIETVLSRT